MNDQHGVNSIEIDGSPYLLARVSGSHLVPEATLGEPAEPAVPEWRVEAGKGWQSAYDMSALTEKRWRSTTLCGREWSEMQAGDGPVLAPRKRSVFAPDCRTCLRIVGQHLVVRPPAERIPAVVALVVELLREHGLAIIREVPGDQLENLRKAIRSRTRKEGIEATTHLIDGDLNVVDHKPKDEDVYRIMNSSWNNDEATRAKPSDWTIYWHAVEI